MKLLKIKMTLKYYCLSVSVCGATGAKSENEVKVGLVQKSHLFQEIFIRFQLTKTSLSSDLYAFPFAYFLVSLTSKQVIKCTQ